MIKIFCVTNKPLPILEKSALNLAGVGEHDFSSNYINSKIKNNIHHKEKFYSELTFHYCQKIQIGWVFVKKGVFG